MTDYAIELDFPNITPYARGNGGIPYLWTFDSGVPGPHVMVNALTHGNEVCGAIVVKELLDLRIRPRRGRLTLSLPLASWSAPMSSTPPIFRRDGWCLGKRSHESFASHSPWSRPAWIFSSRVLTRVSKCSRRRARSSRGTPGKTFVHRIPTVCW
jgi:hypothetical protein